MINNSLVDELIDELDGKKNKYIHIRIRQRKNRKFLTTIEGLDDELDLNRLLKQFKKQFHCNGHIAEGVIELTGDQRDVLKQFLIEEDLSTTEFIKLHGF